MEDRSYDLRVYAEGVRIPAYGITRTQQVGAPLEFTVRLPPTPSAFRVLPDTVVHAFVKEGEEPWGLFAEGRVKNRALRSAKGRLATRIRCEGIDGDWNETSMGFDVDQNRGFVSEKEAHFFYGLSSAEDEEIFDGVEGARGAQMADKSSKGGSRFFSYKFALDQFIEKEGPVQAIVSILGSMGSLSPIFRRNYNALGTDSRIGYVENKRITKWLQKDNTLDFFRRRFRELPASATLMDVVRLVLRESFHEMVTLPSAPFRKPKRSETPDEPNKKKEKLTVGSGEIPDTTPDMSLPQLRKDPRIRAYLDTIAQAEFNGLGYSKKQQYKTLYGGREFQNLKGLMHHPRVYADRGDGKKTSAAGRYQITATTWDQVRSEEYGQHLGGFSPKEQDYAAIALLKKEGAIEPILNGNIKEANHRAAQRWASIPDRSGTSPLDALRSPDLTHEDLRDYYDTFEKRQIEEGYSAPAPTVDGRPPGAMKTAPETLPTHLIKPTIREAPPPRCNVLFDNQIESISAQERFTGTPTRLMMRRELGILSQLTGRSPAAEEITNKRAYAPRKIAYLISQLKDGGEIPDVMSESEKESFRERVQEAEAEDVPGSFEELSESIEKKRAAHEETAAAALNDMMSAIQNGNSALPSHMLSLYTMEELLRGVQPSIGKFPFPKLGTDGAVPEIEQDISDAIQTNEDIISSLTPLTNEVVQEAMEARKDALSNYEEDTESLTADSIWANYKLSMLRKSSRVFSVSLPLNTSLAVGFPAAVHHPALGWTTGTIEKVTDRVSVREESASTEISMSHCTFHTDRKNPVREHIEMANSADGHKMNEAGYPRNPIFFEDRFSDQSIGDEMYQDLLEVGSVIDWANELSGDSSEDTSEDASEGGPMSVADALQALHQAYKNANEPRSWVRRNTSRPVATEEEFFKGVLGAEQANSGTDWSAPYRVFEMASRDQAFMKERADWARNYRSEIQDENNAIDATFADETG
jgi:muramidase (phage lysozyme)